ncbi:hypothetical protein ISP14_18375 [Dyella agri]|uniref:Uncharacterized protein n=1 Tax=Dyella agri TaxID=1926869 RepID=A0ABW8KMQ6_9GAMM
MFSLGVSATAFAGNPPATGLGQAWPNAADVSANPSFHVYVFVLGGVKYVQVNDLNGNVLGAFGTAGGQFVTLPVGRFAQLVTTPQTPAAVTTAAVPSAAPATVYRDGSTTVTATLLSDGTLQLNATPADSDTCDPIECNNHIQ